MAMSKVEVFITGLRAKDAAEVPNEALTKLIKDVAAEEAGTSADNIGVAFAEHDVIEIAVSVEQANDPNRIGLNIAGILDSIIADRIEWTEIRMHRVGP